MVALVEERHLLTRVRFYSVSTSPDEGLKLKPNQRQVLTSVTFAFYCPLFKSHVQLYAYTQLFVDVENSEC